MKFRQDDDGEADVEAVEIPAGAPVVAPDEQLAQGDVLPRLDEPLLRIPARSRAVFHQVRLVAMLFQDPLHLLSCEIALLPH